ncbi:MAG TPA: hypothetical protein VM243_14085 [Phycisphaerae bacterium]|nr:hypothetical protein [Phycisphaerae bacterium]
MALTANREVDHYVDQELRSLPVAGFSRVYKGAFVGVQHDGYVRGLVAGDRFCGIAYEEGDNSSGGATQKQVRVYTMGDFALTLNGLATTDRLKPVYATDDATLSLTGGPKASYVGRVVDRLGTNLALVRLGDLGHLPADDQDAQLDCFEDFIGAALNTTDGPWKTVDVGDATEGVVADAHGGEFALALAATDEAEDAVLYQGDAKNFDIDSKLIVEFRAKVVSPGSGVTAVFGLAGDHDLDKDSIAQNAWFRLVGGLDLLLETDDGTTDVDDVDTTVNLISGTYNTFRIDLTDPSDVKFFVDNIRVGSSTTFDMSGFSGRLQPYFSLDKGSGTGTAVLTLDWVRVTATRA